LTAEARFNELFADHHPAILAYLQRRAAPEDAADVAAEVFTVAWRRIDEVPADHDALLWLYGVARRALSNNRRGAARRGRLSVELAGALRTATPPDIPSAEVLHVRAVLAKLPEADREILLLSGWEGLQPSAIAAVIGTNTGAVRVRLHRARSRLRKRLRDTEATADLRGLGVERG
jgi:RNA polymerase sigma factor (sigma-70 family)